MFSVTLDTEIIGHLVSCRILFGLTIFARRSKFFPFATHNGMEWSTTISLNLRKGRPSSTGHTRPFAIIARIVCKVHDEQQDASDSFTNSFITVFFPPSPIAKLTSIGVGNFWRHSFNLLTRLWSIKAAWDLLSISTRVWIGRGTPGPSTRQSQKRWGTWNSMHYSLKSDPSPRMVVITAATMDELPVVLAVVLPTPASAETIVFMLQALSSRAIASVKTRYEAPEGGPVGQLTCLCLT